MNNLETTVDAYSRINNTVVGCPKNGIITSRGNSYYALNLNDANQAISLGQDAMEDALDSKSVDLGKDFEL